MMFNVHQISLKMSFDDLDTKIGLGLHFLSLIFFIHLFIFYLCVCECLCIYHVCTGDSKVLSVLELEVQVNVRHLMWMKTSQIFLSIWLSLSRVYLFYWLNLSLSKSRMYMCIPIISSHTLSFLCSTLPFPNSYVGSIFHIHDFYFVTHWF